MPDVREDVVEKVARAICVVHGNDPDENAPLGEICTGDNQPVPWWMFYEEDARAAIAAIRTQTDEAERIISAWAFAHNIDGAARNDLFKRLRALSHTPDDLDTVEGNAE